MTFHDILPKIMIIHDVFMTFCQIHDISWHSWLSWRSGHPASRIWKEIRSLVNVKPDKTSSIKILDENQNIISDSQKIANIFNDHYSTLGAKVQQKIPTQEGDFNFYLDKRDKNGKHYIKLVNHCVSWERHSQVRKRNYYLLVKISGDLFWR